MFLCWFVGPAIDIRETALAHFGEALQLNTVVQGASRTYPTPIVASVTNAQVLPEDIVHFVGTWNVLADHMHNGNGKQP